MNKIINFLFGEDDKKEEVKVPSQKPTTQNFPNPKTENRRPVTSPLPELFPEENTSFGGQYGEPYWVQPIEGDKNYGRRTWESNNSASRVKHIENPKVVSRGNSDFYGARDSEKEFGKGFGKNGDKKEINGTTNISKASPQTSLNPTPKTEYIRPVFEEKKLTIIFVENTTEVAKEIDKLEKIVKSLVTTGFVCVINYGSTVRHSEKFEANNFDCSNLLCQSDLGENASMYDAMVDLDDVVKDNYNKNTWSQHKRTRINSIEVIGFGRAIDNFSGLSSELGIKCFESATKNVDIATKYFCLSDEYFVNAARIGFRSIGAITRSNT